MYDAFICYSRANDRQVAGAVQQVVQTLGKPWWKRRTLRVFRDDSSLAATDALWPDIETALARSRYLILLASPEAAASQGVARELGWWLAHRGAENLLLGLTGGELRWDAKQQRFLAASADPIPEPLRYAFRAEPLWVDLRPFRSSAARTSRRNPELLTGAASFAAAIQGIPKEDLLSEETRQQRRGRALAFGAVAALVLLAGVAVAATIQRQLALAEARENLASALVGRAALATHEKEGYKALVFLAEAERASQSGSWPTRSIVIGAAVSKRVSIIDIGAPIDEIRFHPSRNLIAARTSEGIELVDLDGKAARVRLRGGGQSRFLRDVRFDAAGDRVLARNGNSLVYWTLDGSPDATVALGEDEEGSTLQYGLELDQDGTVLFPGSRLRLMKLDGRTLALLGEIKQPGDWIASLAVHPSGRFVATATGNSPEVGVYPTGDALPPVVLSVDGADRSGSRHVAFSPDGRFLAAVQGPGRVRVWKVDAQGEHFDATFHFDSHATDSEIAALAISPDARLLGLAHGDLSISVWDLASGRQISRMEGHRQAVETIAFAPDARYVASGSKDGTIQFWTVVPEHDMGVQLELGTRFNSHLSPCRVAFSRDGSMLALAGAEGDLWMHATEPLSPDTRRQFAVSRILDEARPSLGRDNAKPGRVYDLAAHLTIELQGPASGIHCAQFAENDRYLVASVAGKNSVFVWALPTGVVVDSHSFGDARPGAMAIDDSGRWLATALDDGSVEIAKLDAGHYQPAGHLSRSTPAKEFAEVERLQWSASRSLLLAQGYRTNVLWDVEARTDHPLTSGAAAEDVVGFAGDLEFLLFKAGEDKLLLKSTAPRDLWTTTIEHWNPKGERGHGVASTNGRYVAVALADGAVAIWDSKTRSTRAELARDLGRLVPMCFDPGGTVLVAKVHRNADENPWGEGSSEIEFWDVEAARRIGGVVVPDAGGGLFKADRAMLSGGHPRLALWNDRKLYVRSGITSAELEAAEEASGFGMSGGDLRRLGEADRREVALHGRPVDRDAEVASAWPLIWRLQRDLGAGKDPAVAGEALRAWLRANRQHPFRLRIPELVEELLARSR